MGRGVVRILIGGVLEGRADVGFDDAGDDKAVAGARVVSSNTDVTFAGDDRRFVADGTSRAREDAAFGGFGLVTTEASSSDR